MASVFRIPLTQMVYSSQQYSWLLPCRFHHGNFADPELTFAILKASKTKNAYFGYDTRIKGLVQ
jgi:hypothetical protein